MAASNWIILHLEVQSQPDPDLPRRIWVYAYRCFEKHQQEVFGYAILGDRNQSFRPGPYRWQLGKARLVYEYETAKLIDFRAAVIREDPAGNLWVGTIDGGLNKLPRGGSGFAHFRAGPDGIQQLSSNRIYDIAFDQNGKLWLGTEKGLNILDPASGAVQQVASNARDKFSLKGSSIRSIYIDKQGIYWLGTFQSGVNKYDKNLTAFGLVHRNLRSCGG